jgi:hypothetical protein
VAFFLLFLATLSINYRICYSGGFAEGRGFGSVPGPTLIYPTTDNIDLQSQPFLEFRWERTDLVSLDHCELKLYKGYNTVGDSLLMKKQLSTDDYPFKLDVSNLEVDQVYTWSLIQVYTSGKKSDRSFSSFNIIKK